MNDTTYRQLNAYANSDLSELAALYLGKKRFSCSQEALDFGSLFHETVLEPGREGHIQRIAMLSPAASRDMWGMFSSLTDEMTLMRQIIQSECETVRQWICSQTGLPLKGKLDACVLPKKEHLIDLKTTSCRNRAEFIDTITDYDYDRQAAFYLDSDPNARFFEFVGVQKVAPYNVYRVAYHRSDKTIKYGRKKMLHWLKVAKETGFVPSSWGRVNG